MQEGGGSQRCFSLLLFLHCRSLARSLSSPPPQRVFSLSPFFCLARPPLLSIFPLPVFCFFSFLYFALILFLKRRYTQKGGKWTIKRCKKKKKSAFSQSLAAAKPPPPSPGSAAAFLSSFASADTALNAGFDVPPVSWNSSISLEQRKAPACAARAKPNSRSSSLCEEIPSTARCTSTFLSLRSSVVCQTQTCASMPHRITDLVPAGSACWTSGTSIEKSVLATTVVFVFAEVEVEEAEVDGGALFTTDATSSTVGPRAFGYCSVTTTAGSPRARAPLTSLELVSATASKPAMSGRKRSWTSQTKRTVEAGSRRPRDGDEGLDEGFGDAVAIATIKGEWKERLVGAGRLFCAAAVAWRCCVFVAGRLDAVSVRRTE